MEDHRGKESSRAPRGGKAPYSPERVVRASDLGGSEEGMNRRHEIFKKIEVLDGPFVRFLTKLPVLKHRLDTNYIGRDQPSSKPSSRPKVLI